MEKLLKQISKSKKKISLFLLIVIIGLIVFFCYSNQKIAKQVMLATKSEVKTSQTTVPEGYTGIYTAEDLANVEKNNTGNYILMADIDMTNKTHTIIGQASNAGFKGIFDGNFHTIRNLIIDSTSQYVGLFGYIDGGTIKSLTLENETVKGSYAGEQYIGGLVGYNKAGTIEGVRITGISKIEDASTGIPYIGGLVGYQNGGIVRNSYVEGEILTPEKTTKGNIGGLIGYTKGEVNIEESSNKIKIINNLKRPSTSLVYSHVGGIVGYSNGTSSTIGLEVLKSYSRVNIESSTSTTGTYVGGLIGYTNYKTTIEESYAIGNIKIGNTTSYAGGLIGYSSSNMNVNNAYADVEITGIGNSSSYIGGLIGYSSNNVINNTYAIGKIEVENSSSRGGLVGYKNVATNSYWSPEMVGIRPIDSTAVGETRTIQEMLYKDNYTDWDFNSIWKIEPEGRSLPYLLNNKETEILGENIDYQTYEGQGTEDNPFLIYTIEQLQNIGSTTSTNYYKIMQDLDASSITNFEPIGTNAIPFRGILDGNGYKIRNLTIDSTNQYVGLFGYIDSGTIKSLTLENETVKGSYAGEQYIGGLVGYNKAGTIEGVRITGTSKIEDASTEIPNIGGLVGYQNGGIVRNSYVEGEILTPEKTTKGNIGGLIGYTKGEVNIEESSNKIKIINNLKRPSTSLVYSHVGGIVGYSNGTSSTIGLKVLKSYSRVNIEGSTSTTGTYVGGLIGYTNYKTTIEESYAIGNIKIGSNTSKVGGLIGYINSGSESYTSINNAYTNVEITGIGNTNSNIGGLIGYSYNNTNINNAYAIGKIEVENISSRGGLVGCKNVATNSYWSPEMVGIRPIDSTAVGETRTIQEMLYKDNYTDWDFNSIWKIEPEGRSLPYLLNNKETEILGENIDHQTYEGKGTEDNPYLIYTIEQLQYIKQINNIGTYYYKIMKDIDASTFENFEPIGTNVIPFKGILDGNGYKISNLTINSANQYVGLFGYIDGGTVKNIKIDNLNINSTYTGADFYIGGIVAYNNGTISRVHSNGTIQSLENTTNGYVGGIAGSNKGIIKLSYNTGKINTNNINNLKVGGIAGESSGKIVYSYSKGKVQVKATTVTIGGITGENTGRIAYTYSTDNIEKEATTIVSGGIAGNNTGDILNSYWNIDKIEQQDGKGIYQTLGKLKQQATYENWNFDKIWSIEENIDTPTLKQELYYYDDDYWEWHTRITTDDQAYNGNHIEIADSIKFYGYGITSYKDFLYKDYSYAGEKTFSFILDETKASYHTLDGAGFIFNAKKEDNKLSGYILLIKENDINLYRIDNVDIDTFKTTSNTTVETYAGKPIASVAKGSSKLHQLIIKTSPTNLTVVDNNEEILNVNLDYSTHVGENFGLISSYVQHNCSILTEIEFSEFKLEIKNYTIPVLKVDKSGNPLQGAKFQVKNDKGDIVREGITGTDGIFNIEGLQEGVYTVEEIEAPSKYAMKPNSITFKMTSDGKAVDVNTGEEITLKIENELLKIGLKKYKSGTETSIQGAVIGLFDENENAILDTNGNQVKAISDEKGNIIFTNIEAGTYKYRELEAPSGYLVNNQMYTCTVNNDGTVTFDNNTNGIIYNERVKAGHTVIRKYKTGTETPLQGAVIGLFDEEGNAILDENKEQIKLTTGENGEVDFTNLEVGTYQYKELEAPAGYVLNSTMYKFTVNNDGTVTFANNTDGIIYNERIKSGHTVIRKYKAGTTTPVSGAVIGLFDESGDPILGTDGEQIKLTTNENGQIDFTNLEVGTYQYKELEAPAGYVLNETMYKFTVDNDGTVTFANNTNGIIYNERVKAGHTVIRKYKAGTTTPVSGAVIGLFNESGDPILGTDGEQIKLTTNENGQIDFTNLEVGTYQYKELEAPAGYVLNSTMYKFTVNNDGTVTFANNTNGIIYNERVKAGHTVIRKYKAGTEIPVQGAIIGLFDEEGNAILDENKEQIKLTTGENGEVDFTNLEVGTYQYKELEAPAGYVLNETMYKFTINNDGTVAFDNNTNGIIYNERVKSGHTVIRKYKTGTTTPISGAVIGLFNESGDPILGTDGEQIKLTTGENGEVDFTNLEVGTYQYKELEAPAGYVLNETMYKFTVDNDGTVIFANNTNGIIYNERVKAGHTVIRKYKAGTTTPVSGAVIGLFNESGDPILGTDGEQIKLTTNENGQIDFTNLEVGTYQYKELEAPAGYVLNSTMYKFIVNNDGTVTFANNTNGIIYNERVKAGHTVIRKYKTGTETPIQGAIIGLFDEEGNAILDENKEQIKLTTNENGQIDFTNLEVGTYQYKELEAPAGYVLNSTMYKFTINNDGTVTFANNTDGIIYNERIKSGHTVIRKYKTGTETPVQGAVIGLFNESGDPILGTDGEQIKLTTGENGQIDFTNLEVGTYQYKELEAPTGYVLNEKMYKFTINNDGTVAFDNNTNGIIYNERVKSGHTVIRKYRAGTTTPVSGAVIGLFDEEGNAILDENKEQIKLTTNENGQIDFTNLEVGTYQYKELEAPAGYVLNSTMYKFTVNNDGTVTFANNTNGIIYNERVKSGHTVIRKYKTGTATPISGAVIGLFNESGDPILGTDGEQIKLTTNENGQIDFTNLEVGTYQYKELEAPAGYVLNETMYKFTVSNDGTVTFSNNTNGIIYNERVKAGHTVIRKYKTGTEIPVQGAIIGLFDEEGNAILDENKEQIKLTTGENGEVDFTNLEVGTYQYKELEAPAGYVLNSAMYKFTVNNDRTVTFIESQNGEGKDGIIYNKELEKGTAIIIKYKAGTEIPVQGAVIGLFDESGNPILGTDGEQIKLTTGENGQVEFTNLEVGTYQYKELEAPAGYILNDTMYKFTVNEDGIVTFLEDEKGKNGIIYNDRIKKEHVIITKYETGTIKPVSGAIIGLFRESGSPVLDENGNQIKLTTNKNGQIDFTNLEVGTYHYKELEAPVGYVLNSKMYTFTINSDGTITFIENEDGSGKDGIIYNDRKMSDKIIIIKYETGTTTPVSGAIIGLFDAAGDPILGANGEQVKLTTNEKGQIAFTIKPGKYQYKELKAPDGYILNNTMYKITVNNDGTVTFENGNIIYNDKVKTGDAIIIKYKTGTTTPLSGAVIGIFDKNGDFIKDKEGKQVKFITNEKGKVVFKNLKPGEYQYKELQAPEGYELNDTMYSFKVNDDGTVTFENDTNGIIYNDEKKHEDDDKDKNNVVNNTNTNNTPNNSSNIVENNTNINNIIKNKNTTTKNNKQKGENIISSILPYTGGSVMLFMILVSMTVVSIYYTIKAKKIYDKSKNK